MKFLQFWQRDHWLRHRLGQAFFAVGYWLLHGQNAYGAEPTSVHYSFVDGEHDPQDIAADAARLQAAYARGASRVYNG